MQATTAASEITGPHAAVAPMVLPVGLYRRLLARPEQGLRAVAVHLRGLHHSYATYLATTTELVPGLDPVMAARAWESAATQLGGRDAHQAAVDALEARLGQPWTGATGATDLALLQAWLRLARRWPAFPIPAALAELAVEAGLARNTARRAVGRLVGDGWLVCTSPPGPGLAAEWVPGPLFRHAPIGAATLTVDLGADAGRPRAVGKARLRLWSLLDAEHPVPASVLARRLGRAPGTVRKQLGSLAELGLAMRTPRGWVPGPEHPETLAARRGVAGARRRAGAQLALRRHLRATRTTAAGDAPSGDGGHDLA